jgi:hypothetical protein
LKVDKTFEHLLRCMREVDASIRYADVGGEILVTVECRKRRNRQDDTWIEQLITKKQKLGAARTIAVSSTGFSAPAVQTAHVFGVELRRFEEITDEEIAREWVRGVKLSLIATDWHVQELMIQLDDDTFLSVSEYDPAILPALSSEEGTDWPLACNPSSGEELSIRDLVSQVSPPFGLTTGGPEVFQHIAADLIGENCFVKTTNGLRLVKEIQLLVGYQQHEIAAPIRHAHQYASTEQSLVEVIKGVTEPHNGVRYTIRATTRPDSQKPPFNSGKSPARKRRTRGTE